MARVYKNPENIFLSARLRSSLKKPQLKERNWVALHLSISVDRLVDYETGRGNPPEETVFNMAILYNDIQLILEAHNQTHPLYGGFFRDVFGIEPSRAQLSEMACGYIGEIGDLNQETPYQLAVISKDNQIDPQEKPIMNNIAEHTKRFIGQAAGVLMANTSIKEITATAMAVNR